MKRTGGGLQRAVMAPVSGWFPSQVLLWTVLAWTREGKHTASVAPGQSLTREDSFLTLDNWGFEAEAGRKPSRPQSRHVMDDGPLLSHHRAISSHHSHHSQSHDLPPFDHSSAANGE